MKYDIKYKAWWRHEEPKHETFIEGFVVLGLFFTIVGLLIAVNV